ncbi:hypothetical protein NC651_037517 [Populus alba x Populus x berolinensis]|nr:hypothetical protein NC651_037517 [Populus alba x Populus x berolinensis]
MALKFDQQLAVQQSNIFVLSLRKFISCCFSDDCARINNSLAHNSEELDYIDRCLFIILPQSACEAGEGLGFESYPCRLMNINERLEDERNGVAEGEDADAAQEFFQWRKRVLQAVNVERFLHVTSLVIPVLPASFTVSTS